MISISNEVFLSAIEVYASANLAFTPPSKESNAAVVKWSNQDFK